MSRRGGVSRAETSAYLSDSVMEELELAFRLFAGRDRKEELSADDVFEACRRLGLRDISERDAREMVEEGDLSGTGTIDFEEFATMMSKKMAKSDPEEAVIDAFEKFDWKRTGAINVNELSEALRNLGDPLSASELKEMLDVAQEGDLFYYHRFVKEMFGAKNIDKNEQ
eukprot:TRINITY_DN251_c0_g1_i1.p1 TRINITY_DN251_c0_g1~~TRINITY_DN251_c0_g1_i1.p1  ORF type:complete len:187 (-),score=67.60 TRINITY_DN251_c0_g1_i1:62-568(-)